MNYIFNLFGKPGDTNTETDNRDKKNDKAAQDNALQQRIDRLERANRNLANQISSLERENTDLKNSTAHLQKMHSADPHLQKVLQNDYVQDLKAEIKKLYLLVNTLKESQEEASRNSENLETKYQESLEEFEIERSKYIEEIERLSGKPGVEKTEDDKSLGGKDSGSLSKGQHGSQKPSQPQRVTKKIRKNKIDSFDDFIIQEEISISEKDREILDLRSELTSLKLRIKNRELSSAFETPSFEKSDFPNPK
jgi:hypothetical protein